MNTIVGEYGLVVITREGSNPSKFIYNCDILYKHMVNIIKHYPYVCPLLSLLSYLYLYFIIHYFFNFIFIKKKILELLSV